MNITHSLSWVPSAVNTSLNSLSAAVSPQHHARWDQLAHLRVGKAGPEAWRHVHESLQPRPRGPRSLYRLLGKGVPSLPRQHHAGPRLRELVPEALVPAPRSCWSRLLVEVLTPGDLVHLAIVGYTSFLQHLTFHDGALDIPKR